MLAAAALGFVEAARSMSVRGVTGVDREVALGCTGLAIELLSQFDGYSGVDALRASCVAVKDALGEECPP